jgi:hypothetical protein
MSELRNTLRKIITNFVNFQSAVLEKWELTPRNFLFRAPDSSWGIAVEIHYHYNTIGFIVYDVEFFDGEWEQKTAHTDFIVETDRHIARVLRKEEDLRFRLRDYHREYFLSIRRSEDLSPDQVLEAVVFLSIFALRNLVKKGKTKITLITDIRAVEDTYQLFDEISPGLLLITIQGAYTEEGKVVIPSTGIENIILKVFYDGSEASSDAIKKHMPILKDYGFHLYQEDHSSEKMGGEEYKTWMYFFDVDEKSFLYRDIKKKLEEVVEDHDIYNATFQVSRTPRGQRLYIVGETVYTSS